ncbi:hypothetical protein [Modestobacter sp. I12A-02662]|uniref:hypothetical protein n=1 Tax=Modestobacter sp. I12A-02662 TaxID=1730496 RepID=UPI0034DF7C18
MELLTLVVPPTTLVTALLFWFGFELVDARASYFGLSTGTLGFTTTDYLIRGVQAGIVPLIVLLAAVLGGVAVHTEAHRLADRCGTAKLFGWGVGSVIVGGALAGVVGAYGAFRPLPPPLDWYLLPPILLATGPLVTAFAARCLRPEAPVARSAQISAAAVGGLVLLGLFWATSLYADALGRGSAQQLGASLAAQPRVTVYSERALAIDPAVAPTERLNSEENGRYLYRYSRLRLLIRSAEKYFLLPDNWTPTTGTILVIPDGSEIRIEFAPGGR